MASTGTGGSTIEVMGEVLTYQADRRPCPRHQTPCFARVPYPEARIEWFCPACWLWYDEILFAYMAPWTVDRGVIIACPVCGARAVQHDCTLGCCDNHICDKCEAPLLPEVSVVAPGAVPPSRRSRRKDRPIRTGWRSAARLCGQGHASELVWEHDYPAWWCPECQPRAVSLEHLLWPPDPPRWPAWHYGLVSRGPTAWVSCPTCGAYLSGEAPTIPCARCGAINHVAMVVEPDGLRFSHTWRHQPPPTDEA